MYFCDSNHEITQLQQEKKIATSKIRN